MRPGRVLVTGGASGLGAAVVRQISAAGGTPYVLDRAAPCERVAHALVDVADTAAVHAAVTAAAEELGGVDGVVTAAGTDSCGRINDVPADAWENVIRVNLLGTAAVIRSALPYLEASRGHVVTIASTLGLRALSDASAYCASKFGVVGLSRALAREWEGRVGLTLLIPGGMSTAFFDERPDQYRPPEDADLCDPRHVARTVLFALSMPPECAIRELVVTPATEPSWP